MIQRYPVACLGLTLNMLISNNASGVGSEACSHTKCTSSIASKQRLQQREGSTEFLLDVNILSLDQLLLLEDGLQFLVGLLIGQVVDALLQRLDLGLGPLPDGSLSFPIICPFLRQLVWGEVGNPT